jgi:hypothetical protein
VGDTLHDALTPYHSSGDLKRVQWLGAVARLVAAALDLKARKRKSKLASSSAVADRAVELRALEACPAWADFAPPLAELTEAEAALREAALRYAEVRGRGDMAGAWGALVELVARCKKLPGGLASGS